jgi:peptide/nickel transport system substrate-binding protein
VRDVRSSKWSWLAILAALALIMAACPEEDPDPVDDNDVAVPPDPDVDFTYNTGIFEDARTDNRWSYHDSADVWTAYMIGPTGCGLYGIEFPNIAVVPSVAAEDVPLAEEDADGNWFVDIQVRDDVVWSDGEPLTAHDYVFTFETARELGLGGHYLSYWPPVDDENPDTPAVENVEAVDDHTIRISFNVQPGLPIWPHAAGFATIQPEHFWADVVEEALGTEDPSETLLAASGAGAPACGATVFAEWEPDAFARVTANDQWHNRGSEVIHYEDGSVEVDGTLYGEGEGEGEIIAQYTTGPHFDEQVFTLYGAQDAAVLGLRGGEVDFLFNPLGLERGLQEPVIEDPNLEIAVNAANGMRYLAFNMRDGNPTADLALRQAIATIVDRQFMAETVLGGVAFPMFSMIPRGNLAWFNEEVDEEVRGMYMDGSPDAERFEAAVDILREAGYTWDVEPTLDDAGDPVPGEGIVMPDGTPMPNLTINSLSPGYDPLRATYGLWIERWGRELGLPVTAELTGFGPLVDVAFETDDFDMFILGWSLGNPAMPSFHEAFFHSRWESIATGGNNAPGYNNPDFDAAADRFLVSQTIEEAYDILWNEMEPMLAEDLPYLVLFDTPIVEGYRAAAVQYPFTDTLGGLQFIQGAPSVVTGAQ